MGSIDKCALPLHGRAMASYAVDAIAPVVASLVVVVAPQEVGAWTRIAERDRWPAGVLIEAGGASRHASARAGIEASLRLCVPEVIVIHDGARPLVTPALVAACCARAATCGAAIAATPVTDTIKRVTGERIVETPDRDALWAAQTPQAFRTALLVKALAWQDELPRRTFTDEASLIEGYGHPVCVVLGERTNIKLTEPTDRIIAEALLASRTGAPHA